MDDTLNKFDDKQTHNLSDAIRDYELLDFGFGKVKNKPGTNHYVTEEELREEIYKIQHSQYLSSLDEKLQELQNTPTPPQDEITNIKNEITTLEEEGIIRNYSKEKFGVMILKIVHRLAKRGNFAGYTENYKVDFYSNALEKILSYAINNIDLDMISPRSNERVKVFAYLTQIASNAFIEVINKRNQEQDDLMEKIIPFEDFYEQVKKYYNPVYEKQVEIKEQPDVKIYFNKIQYNEDILEGDTSLENEIFTYTDEDNVQWIFEIINDSESQDNLNKMYLEKTNGLFKILNECMALEIKKIQLVYPEYYKMSLDEYTEINLLKFDYLNLTRLEKEKYKPSFPKKQKKEKIDCFVDWE